ncbi:iron-sulfur protein [Spirochaetia bacterium]|nr:iron-sulfur protein [Spirochaetia bacterium]
MTGLYFSGTGNTKHCVEEFVHCFDPNNQTISIESFGIENSLANEDIIIFGHPTCFSNAPKIVRDYIRNHKQIFAGRKVFVIVTMGLFSGDGAGCSARILKKCGAEIIGGLHLRMSDCIGDNKMLKKTLEENKLLVEQANIKIHLATERLKGNKPFKEGLNILYHIAGLFGQRLWFYGKSFSYKNKPNIDLKKCIDCGFCIKNCPMKNLEKKDGIVVHNKKCTMCYRCVNNCPVQALTILGGKIYEQCIFEKYNK